LAYRDAQIKCKKFISICTVSILCSSNPGIIGQYSPAVSFVQVQTKQLYYIGDRRKTYLGLGLSPNGEALLLVLEGRGAKSEHFVH
jgi:hypothetical protein